MSFKDSKILNILKDKKYLLEDVGMSDAEIRIYDDKVLKISDLNLQSINEHKMLKELEGKIPVPKVYDYKEIEDKSYLLMNRVEGRLASDDYYINNPDLLITILADTLKLFWSVDISNLNNPTTLDTKLRIAKYNVDHNLVDLDNVEHDTFSEGSFANPEELLNFLIKNKPEEELVLSHGDLTLENMIIKDDKLAAVIDLGLTGIGDIYQDIALIFRSLANDLGGIEGIESYKEYEAELFFKKLDITPNWEKLRYFLLLDELF